MWEIWFFPKQMELAEWVGFLLVFWLPPSPPYFLFLFQTLGWLVGYALFTWLQSKGLITLSQVCCKINFNHLQHHPIYPHGHALHTTSSLWSNINLADPRDHNHDHLSPVPVDMGQPVPGVNIGAHLLQERNQTHPTCQLAPQYLAVSRPFGRAEALKNSLPNHGVSR